MTGKIALLACSFLIVSPLSMALAQDNDPGVCNTMLETAIGQGLQGEGFDTSNVCDLTLNQLVQIKSLLATEGMGARPQIELILSRAGE